MTATDHPLADPHSFVPVSDGAASRDPLSFPGYERLRAEARDRSGVDESVVAGPATIGGVPVELAAFDFAFLGGSMGEVAGERLALALDRAAERGVPFVLRTATGGARMQEGMGALVQMPKVVVARRRLAETRRPYIAVLGHPTTGGVLASIGGLADVTVAESGATVGFAGPRVVESVTGRPVQGDSHTAATAFGHGLVDDVVPASEARSYVTHALSALRPDEPAVVRAEPPGPAAPTERDAWELVQDVRGAGRPRSTDVVATLGDPVLPLRGDRAGTDDPALAAAIVRVRGRRALTLALDRDHAPGPGAYRKARRCVEIAQRLDIPVVSFIDTRGADPSPSSENRGIAWEIAATFDAMLGASVPTIAIVTGEGGSGGALAFGVSDSLFALETSVFSVIGPEGAAQIMWKDTTRAPEAARLLRLSSHDLARLGIADAVWSDHVALAGLDDLLAYHLDRLRSIEPQRRLEQRYERWRRRT